MQNSNTNICPECGEQHTEWPALTYKSPFNYSQLSEEAKSKIGELSSDFCEIKYESQTDRFIRVTLSQKVIGTCENLEYGLWVSLSKESYNDYLENFDNENHKTGYFGWLCSDILEYKESTMNIPCNVFTKLGNQRPEIIPHDDHDHQFVKDYYSGITLEEVQNRVNKVLK
ncbi:DUF2199 domain-containing protein [Flammeovirga agarivorans]|uniref:DUF2199 domain-containing protein n=1 Tax=Flammeovirga agarivorans TaxID=2726742 RepID=A0A7X8SRK5_9BACT|nr:DUF2199 domain-containing protein [Flammeovirga agarivorans]NLR95080.1 DUF2199 domain-containing protein [Flammeovirga agarivorans]